MSEDGTTTAAVVRDGDAMTVVVFAMDPSGADVRRSIVDVPASGQAGDLVITSLVPGERYLVHVADQGAIRRIGFVQSAAGAAEADAGGTVHVRLTASPGSQAGVGASAFAAAGAAGLGQAATAKPTATPGTAAGGAASPAPTGTHSGLVRADASTDPDLAQWDQRLARMLKSGDARLRETTTDALVPGRTLQRIAQLYKGVPVFGGEVSRQIENKKTVSVFGTLYERIDLDPVPRLTTVEASEVFQKLSGSSLGPSLAPELVVLPTDDGAYRLVYRARVATADDVLMYFIDANTGETVLSFSDLKRPVL
jgi:hypothetical protein